MAGIGNRLHDRFYPGPVNGGRLMCQCPYALYGEGPTLEDCDLITTSIPLSVAKRSHILLTKRARNLDKHLLDGLERKGFKLDFGEDETGWQFKYLTRGGGYYFNVGCSDLIIAGEVGLRQFSDIAEFVVGGARMRSGETLAADLIVLATGYQGQEHLVRKLFGDEVAARVGAIWGFGDGEELRNMFTRTAQGGRGSEIYSVDITGRNERRVLTPGGASDPAWSPLIQ